MSDVDAVPSADSCRASLRRSRERRACSARSRRNAFRGRGIVAALVAAMTLVAGVATAADGGAAAGAAPAASAASWEKALKRGSRGRAVKAVQRRLRLAADGVFGPATERAVKRFQRRKGLTADGIVGAATARALGLRIATGTRRSASGSPTATLERIAQCESGGNPRAVSPGGHYRGKYQFSRETWRSLGGKGDPAKASEAEQDRLALKLYERRGTGPWPSCA